MKKYKPKTHHLYGDSILTFWFVIKTWLVWRSWTLIIIGFLVCLLPFNFINTFCVHTDFLQVFQHRLEMDTHKRIEWFQNFIQKYQKRSINRLENKRDHRNSPDQFDFRYRCSDTCLVINRNNFTFRHLHHRWVHCEVQMADSIELVNPITQSSFAFAYQSIV